MSSNRTINGLPFVRADKATQVAYAAVSAIQTFEPAEQVAGAALLLSVITSQLNIHPGELLNKAKRWENDADTYYQREIKALRDYTNGELK